MMQQQRRNTYWLLRHGRSKANESGTVVSLTANGVQPAYGLSDGGHQQAVAAGELLAKTLSAQELQQLLVYSSPFSRTMDTAKGALQGLANAGHPLNLLVLPADALRERYFGAAMELGSDSQYAAVWEQDAVNPHYCPGGDGESVAAVSERLINFIAELETSHSGASILLVGHCDTLAILEATLRGTPLTTFRQYALRNCECRQVP